MKLNQKIAELEKRLQKLECENSIRKRNNRMLAQLFKDQMQRKECSEYLLIDGKRVNMALVVAGIISDKVYY